MATEKVALDITSAHKTLTDLGAVSTKLVIIQEDDSDPFFCRSVLRGVDANNQPLPDQLVCPPPCNISKAFNPNA